NSDFSPQKIKIQNPGEIHHLKNVLRMVKGDHLELFNGQGDEVTGMVESISAMEVIVRITERHPTKINALSVVLACAVPKKAKFEMIVEKCTELGVDEIIPIRTARTEVIWKEEKGQRKSLRYQTIAVNASKQSARTTVPVVQEQKAFADVVAGLDEKTLGLIPCLSGNRKLLKDVCIGIKPFSRILILIGPEGDFTPQELETALKKGFVPVSLGETTLKVDTAAIASVAFIRQMLFSSGVG
ncbi:MAG: 16S rRNA (uracil(1498)-N(3))-methyltransferase, partial [Candidatus Omnitrophica bacterium]|nr:16S rRNA (uracil(1498)-N(3))-methyltransferase [Candidatus Omnitrophota bacterium]